MKKSAVFTIVKNESFFLPIWLKYFSKHFEQSDIYILDHQSDDGSTDNLSVTVVPITNDLYFDHYWLVEQVQNFQHELLKSYDYVLFCESDELIVPDSRKFSGLQEYIQSFQLDVIAGAGYELIHIPSEEPPIDLEVPILQQRKFWFRNDRYGKPVITRIPLSYELGFHSASECKVRDENLILLHLHRLDYAYFQERHAWKRKQNFKDDGPRAGWQHRASGEELKNFYFGQGNTDRQIQIVEFEDWLKAVV